jgi:hypothetical protein
MNLVVSMLLDASNFFIRRSILTAIMLIPSTWYTPQLWGWRRSPSQPLFAIIFSINSLAVGTCNEKKAPLATVLALLTSLLDLQRHKKGYWYTTRSQINPQEHGYRCSFHPGVFQGIDFHREREV